MSAPLPALSTVALSSFALEEVDSQSVERALRQAGHLVAAAEGLAMVLAELGAIELPPAAEADSAQLRAVASLYLASTLEAAGLIAAAEDLTRLVRTGTLQGDLADAAELIKSFWDGRNDRVTPDERLALFGRLFGAPSGPVDAAASINADFEMMLLDLCDAIIKAADGGPQGRVRVLGQRIAENLAGVSNDMTLMLAREVIDSLGMAIALLNHRAVKAMLRARTLWDAVAAIDRRFGRPNRSTLTHLRRGRAGMAVLAWLADAAPSLDRAGALIDEASPVVTAAIDWLDETLSIARTQEETDNARAPARSAVGGSADWTDLGR